MLKSVTRDWSDFLNNARSADKSALFLSLLVIESALKDAYAIIKTLGNRSHYESLFKFEAKEPTDP
jgi:hypothetical protein